MLYNEKESDILMIIDLLNYPNSQNQKKYTIQCANPDFEQELLDIIDKCGNETAFVGLYTQRLHYLKETKDKCFLRKQWFEKLKHDPNHRLYSMKFKSGSLNKNLRILFICTRKCIILLNPFVENSNKSYNKNIEIANKRIERLITLKLLERDDIICHNI